MKFYEHPYTITKEYEEKLESRRLLFMEVTGENRGVVLTMITPNGLGVIGSEIYEACGSKKILPVQSL